MKQHLELREMAAELDRQRTAKRDFTGSTTMMEAVIVNTMIQQQADPHTSLDDIIERTTRGEDTPERVTDDRRDLDREIVKLRLADQGEFDLTDHAAGQVAGRLKIPKVYFDRMAQSAPDLLCQNINHWLKSEPETRMIRTLDGHVRAFLSDRFRALDNYDLAEAIIPAIIQAGCEIISCGITEAKFYIKAVTEKFTEEIEVGKPIQAGIVITNSEVGAGSLSLATMLYEPWCSNGCTHAKDIKRAHIGRKHRSGNGGGGMFESGGNNGDDIEEAYTDQTRALDDAAFWSKIKDGASHILSEKNFRTHIAKVQTAQGREIPAHVPELVEVVSERYAMGEGERKGVLDHLISRGNLTQWGVSQAVTRHSQDVESYDRASDLEQTGGKIVELTGSDWRRIISESERKAEA